ncbi:MAG: ACT domain-containing protein, partial [Alphaproteobacteria bacterium]
AERAEIARNLLVDRIGPTPQLAAIEAAYWTSFPPETQARHAAALAKGGTNAIVVGSNMDAGRSTTEILVAAPDRPGLFADLCGALSAAGANIVAAHLYASGENRVLDVFEVQDSRGQPLGSDHPHALERLIADLRAAAAGGEGVKKPNKAPAPSRRHAAFIISPTVLIDRTASATSTVIEVSGRDRQGLLYDIARELVDANLSIRSAHVGAYGERVHDVFYVEPVNGGVMPADMDETLSKRLEEILRSNSPTAPRIPAHTLARAPASFDR